MATRKAKKVTITPKAGKAKAGKAKAGAAKKPKKKDLFNLIDLPDDLAGRAREVWLAGLGALSTVEEEGSKVFKRLVARGEAWEKEGRQKLGAAKDKLDAAKDKVEEAVEDAAAKGGQATRKLDEKVVSAVEESVEAVLQRLGVPTRAEVKELAGQVEKLSRQVGALAAVIEQQGK